MRDKTVIALIVLTLVALALVFTRLVVEAR